MKLLSYFRKKKKEEAYGLRVRDFLHMLKMAREECRETELQGDGVEKALNQAILCVERAYPGIEPMLGSCLDRPMPVGFVRNRLLTLINYYCTMRYGYGKCVDEECGERTPDCPVKCRFRGWEDEYCKMLREAIRCVEVMGTGVPEPPTISFEDIR